MNVYGGGPESSLGINLPDLEANMDNEIQAEAVRRGVEVPQLRVRGWACRIDGNGKYLGAWKHLTHEFQALARDLHAQARYAG